MQTLRVPVASAARQIPRIAARAPQRFRSAGLAKRHASTTTAVKPGALAKPLNIPKWVQENSHLLKPPINNFCVHNDPLTVMIVGGPNARSDYHINSTPEFFYQHKGRMLLKTITNDQFEDIYIDEGELFLLPANVPHNPVRFADTVGVVVEQPRPEAAEDVLRWYCQGCGEKVAERSFVCKDLGTQIKAAVQEFEKDEESRKCHKCGTVCNVRPSAEAMEKMRTGP